MDRISRQLALIAYLLACIVVAKGGEWLWLALAIFMTANYQVQSNQDNPFFFIESKLPLKLRPHLTVPFMIFSWSCYTR